MGRPSTLTFRPPTRSAAQRSPSRFRSTPRHACPARRAHSILRGRSLHRAWSPCTATRSPWAVTRSSQTVTRFPRRARRSTARRSIERRRRLSLLTRRRLRSSKTRTGTTSSPSRRSASPREELRAVCGSTSTSGADSAWTTRPWTSSPTAIPSRLSARGTTFRARARDATAPGATNTRTGYGAPSTTWLGWARFGRCPLPRG
mmetsp:Transcript_24479/g.82429  ORF Transcript_24479/g.82429 Transcript_24479/m.82429 type:complete len:203 (-) Transcript_24479:310-918(-)